MTLQNLPQAFHSAIARAALAHGFTDANDFLSLEAGIARVHVIMSGDAAACARSRYHGEWSHAMDLISSALTDPVHRVQDEHEVADIYPDGSVYVVAHSRIQVWRQAQDYFDASQLDDSLAVWREWEWLTK